MTISYRETKNLNPDEPLQSLERIPWGTAFLFEGIDNILNALESMLRFLKHGSLNPLVYYFREFLLL